VHVLHQCLRSRASFVGTAGPATMRALTKAKD
jgi:hypothetical protein